MNTKALYWEDFSPGKEWTAERPQPVSRQEIIEFALMFDPLDIHIDPEQAARAPLGVHCASGVHTFAMAQRMLCDAFFLKTNLVAGGKFEALKLLRTVLSGDRLHLSSQVLNAYAHTRKPDRGWVVFKVEVFNQDKNVVLTYDTDVLIMRRPA
ncbi:MaoC/PaaZ C-terminal domain-containing protein [Pseudomonas sp. SMN5]|uniref:MaoC/PaaZ C-terminal domain-containing protein n=1 Tax=Pseudomonas sp. SMN5 TaxID=3390198 RepID=UPI003F871624